MSEHERPHSEVEIEDRDESQRPSLDHFTLDQLLAERDRLHQLISSKDIELRRLEESKLQLFFPATLPSTHPPFPSPDNILRLLS